MRILFATLILIASVSFGAHKVMANPSQIMRESTATSASTVSYMRPGIATTTLTFDTQEDFSYPIDSVALAIQMTASSTASQMNINLEYSSDGSDWYQNNLGNISSSTPQILKTPQTYNWTFASSTPGLGGIPATNNKDHKIMFVDIPTRYVRAIFTVPIGASNAGVWAEFVGKKELR